MRPRQPLSRLLGILLLAAVALGSVISSTHHHHDAILESPACDICLLAHAKHGPLPVSSSLDISPLPVSGATSFPGDTHSADTPRLFAARAPPVRGE